MPCAHWNSTPSSSPLPTGAMHSRHSGNGLGRIESELPGVARRSCVRLPSMRPLLCTRRVVPCAAKEGTCPPGRLALWLVACCLLVLQPLPLSLPVSDASPALAHLQHFCRSRHTHSFQACLR